MSHIRRSLVSIIALVLLRALPLLAGTATELAPLSAPTGARFVVAGSGLDAGTLVISFASVSGPLPAQIVSRTATLVEGIVPAAATSGSVQVTQGGAAIASFGFTVTAPPGYGHVATLATSDKAHDVLKSPAGVAVIASTGAVIVADTAHHRIVSVSGAGVVSLLAGSGKPGQTDGAGAAAQFKSPSGVVVDQQRNVLYVADTGNNVIRRVTFDGIVSTLAGSGRPEDADGTGMQSGFKGPMGIAADLSGNVYVADTGNSKIKMISPAGVVHTIAGGTHEGLGDGPALQALFKQPQGVAVSSTGVVFVGDTANNVIRKLENGTVTTIAGTGHGGYANGSGAISEFKQPSGITVDDGGNVYVADTQNNAIRRITIAGTTVTVSTLAGGGKAGLLDGDPATAKFSGASGVVFAGVIYVADTGNDSLRAIVPALDATAVYPHGGPSVGGNQVRVFGKGFLPGPTQVTFGATPATNVTFVSSTELLATAPAGSGTVDVKVTAASGSDTLSAAYTYLPPPTIASVQPAKGATAGGTSLTINGTAFMTGQTTVTLGGVAAAVTVVNSGSLTVATPANAAGPADVVVTTPGGSATLPHAFTYFAPPVITSFAPSQGAAGSVVTITGQNFDPDATGDQVLFGSLPATIQSASPTQLVVTAPAGVTSGRISVTTAGGTATSATDFSTNTITGLAISAPVKTIDAGTNLQLSALGLLASGGGIDVTAQAGWSSSGAGGVVSSTGRLTAIAAGPVDITAVLGTMNATFHVDVVSVRAVPDPVAVAPKNDLTVVQPLADQMRFLYSGTNPIQTGVAPNTIDDTRVTAARGFVRNPDGTPLRGVHVTVVGHAEYGETVTRTDGGYELAVNGGGAVSLQFAKNGYLTAQRLLASQWQERKVLGDVVLLAYDTQATKIAMGAAAPQVARASVVNDSDGSRRATILFPASTTATVVMPDGSAQPAAALTVRATEFTVGAAGQQAMPAALPATSGYTYCVDLTADEATTIGAASVQFSKPVPFYIENFLGLPAGTVIPVGYYDRPTAAWKSSTNGVVLKILSVSGGVAAIDTNGDGVADNAATLAAAGIDAAELGQLASLYPSGQMLWRAAVTHFTPFDANMPLVLPADATTPNQPAVGITPAPTSGSCYLGSKQPNNSIVECSNQTLGESVAITGTPYSLEYDSSRAARTQYKAVIHLSGATVPTSLLNINLAIVIAGRSITKSFAPQPNLDYTFVWDGLDAYGRQVQGMQTAFVTIDYVYPNYYGRPSSAPNAWTRAGDGTILSAARSTAALSQSFQIQLGHYAMQNAGFGGWTLNAQQFYDSNGKTIYEAGGTQRAGDPQQNGQLAISTVAGNGQCCQTAEGARATDTPLYYSYSIAPAPDGSFYFIDASYAVWKVDTKGIATQVAGKWNVYGFTPDGQPALGGALNPWDIAVGPDGALYINDQGNGRVRKVVNGVYVTVAGNGTFTDTNVDGLRATDIGVSPQGIAVGPDNTLYIADAFRILRVGTDGIVTTIAGNGTHEWETPDGIATKTGVGPLGIAVGPEGSVYISDSRKIRRITPDGMIKTVAGTYDTSAPAVQDGQLATSGQLPTRLGAGLHLNWGFSVAPDGTVVIADLSGAKVLAVAPNGILTTVAGTGKDSGNGILPVNGLLARGADVDYPWDVKVAADGSLLIADYDLNAIRRTASMFPAYRATGVIVPSSDGAAAFWFDGGRHTKTIDTLTGVTEETFGYDANGLLTTITDVDGNVTTIERDGNGNPTAIVAPGGQRTTLAVTAGMMTAITNPAGESYQFQYDANGLLRQTTDRRGGLHAFTYDADGLLTRDAGPDGGFITLVRSGNGSNYTVTKTTAEGRVESFGLTLPGQTTEKRIHVRTDGLIDSIVSAGASTTYTSADGSTGTDVTAPDPRFGMLAPTSASSTLKMGSHTLTTQHTLAVTLADPQNPLSVTGLSEAMTLNGATWTTAYDAATRTFTSTTPVGRQTATVLDGKGRTVSVAPAGVTPSFLTYDGSGQVVTVQQGARTVALTYDAARRLASITDPMQRTTRFAYDGADRVTSQTFPDGRAVSLTYDTAGNLTSVTPPSRSPHAFTFTPVDLTASYSPPAVFGGGATLYEYNKDRDLTLITRPDGKTVAIGYDTDGRLSTETIARGQYRVGYNAQGQVASTTSPDGVSLQYSYDGPLLMALQWGGSAPQSGISVTYDANLRLSSETIAGDTIGWSYDTDGLLTAAGALSLTRDAQTGFLSSSALGPATDALSYDTFGQFSTYTASASGLTLFSEQVIHDDAGQITHKTETVLGESHAYEYGYDTSARLQTITKDGAVTATYAFDPNGNRLTRTTPATTESGTYDSQDRMLSYAGTNYTYTANGELSSKTDATGTTSYVYDEMGNLVQVTLPSGGVVTYVIDGQNHRVAKAMNGITLQRWIYDGDLRVAAELDANGALVTRFIYATHVNVPDYMVRGGLTYRIFTDHLGSPRLIVETSTGAVGQRMDYDEFGNVTNDTNSGFQPFAFAGGLYDADTKLVRFGARDYDPRTGRWTIKDPIGFGGLDSNYYTYVANDPINFIDPTGLRAWECSDKDIGKFLSSERLKKYEGVARQLGLPDQDFVLAVSAWESTWGTSAAATDGRNNFFGVGRAATPAEQAQGKDRVLKSFKSEDASIQDWVNRYGNDVRGTTNIGDFIQKLEQRKGGSYNTKDNDRWRKGIRKRYNQINQRECGCG